jgi:hypothetical protein
MFIELFITDHVIYLMYMMRGGDEGAASNFWIMMILLLLTFCRNSNYLYMSYILVSDYIVRKNNYRRVLSFDLL